jgi:hypothetical protein
LYEGSHPFHNFTKRKQYAPPPREGKGNTDAPFTEYEVMNPCSVVLIPLPIVSIVCSIDSNIKREQYAPAPREGKGNTDAPFMEYEVMNPKRNTF